MVSFAPADVLSAFERELGLPYRYYGDPERRAYEAFGFGRASVARAWLHPRVLARYAALLARGRRIRRPGQDTLQLGGDVLLSAHGVVEWVHRSRGPEDRPSVQALLRAGRARGGSTPAG